MLPASGPPDRTRSSSSNDNNSDVCNFDDHPYNSPDEDSDNDDEIVEMNFSAFSMANSLSTVTLTVLPLIRQILDRGIVKQSVPR